MKTFDMPFVTKKPLGANGAKILENFHEASGLHYYEVKNNHRPLVLIHAQGVDSRSHQALFKTLSEHYHLFAIDCYGHGKSLHNPKLYNVQSISKAVTDFVKEVVKEKAVLLGHSSGGLIAAHVAAYSDVCCKLILEDPPFFSSQGKKRFSTFNYADLSSICHSYLVQTASRDFVLYYFEYQYAWQFFPENSREKIKQTLIKAVKEYRHRYPDKDLKIPFWPKSALEVFKGLNHYDPRFGENFYNDAFHCGIPHEEILKRIRCETLLLKAKTDYSPDGSLLLAALDEDDLKKVCESIPQCKVIRFNCGHNIHGEKSKKFLQSITKE